MYKQMGLITVLKRRAKCIKYERPPRLAIHHHRSNCTQLCSFFFGERSFFSSETGRLLESSQAQSSGKLLALRPFSTSLRFDEFLRGVIIGNELALAHMSAGLRSPHLVGERSPLALGVLVRAAGVHTRVEFASSLDVSELASFGFAVGSIAAERHAGVLEMAELVGAVRVEFAHLLCLVYRLNSR